MEIKEYTDDFFNNSKSIKFIDKLNYLENFRTNFKILDGNLKPLLKLNEVIISRFYRNYNVKYKDLPHVTVWISNGYVVKLVRLDSLELGKEDPRIIWLK